MIKQFKHLGSCFEACARALSQRLASDRAFPLPWVCHTRVNLAHTLGPRYIPVQLGSHADTPVRPVCCSAHTLLVTPSYLGAAPLTHWLPCHTRVQLRSHAGSPITPRCSSDHMLAPLPHLGEARLTRWLPCLPRCHSFHPAHCCNLPVREKQ